MRKPDHLRPVAFDSEYFLSTKMDNVLAVMRGANRAKLEELRISSATITNKILQWLT